MCETERAWDLSSRSSGKLRDVLAEIYLWFVPRINWTDAIFLSQKEIRLNPKETEPYCGDKEEKLPSLKEKTFPMKGGDEPMQSCEAMRQSARGVLNQRISDYRRKADNLEILSGCLPMELSPEADAALWCILVSIPN